MSTNWILDNSRYFYCQKEENVFYTTTQHCLHWNSHSGFVRHSDRINKLANGNFQVNFHFVTGLFVCIEFELVSKDLSVFMIMLKTNDFKDKDLKDKWFFSMRTRRLHTKFLKYSKDHISIKFCAKFRAVWFNDISTATTSLKHQKPKEMFKIGSWHVLKNHNRFQIKGTFLRIKTEKKKLFENETKCPKKCRQNFELAKANRSCRKGCRSRITWKRVFQWKTDKIKVNGADRKFNRFLSKQNVQTTTTTKKDTKD